MEEGDFDLYVLEQVWPNNFCCTNDRVECNLIEINSTSSTHLTLSGLWPEFQTSRTIWYQNYQWPQYCSDFAKCAFEFDLDEKVNIYFLIIQKVPLLISFLFYSFVQLIHIFWIY